MSSADASAGNMAPSIEGKEEALAFEVVMLVGFPLEEVDDIRANAGTLFGAADGRTTCSCGRASFL